MASLPVYRFSSLSSKAVKLIRSMLEQLNVRCRNGGEGGIYYSFEAYVTLTQSDVQVHELRTPVTNGVCTASSNHCRDLNVQAIECCIFWRWSSGTSAFSVRSSVNGSVKTKT